MRDEINVQDGWHVSPSGRDALLAASGKPFEVADLEYVGEPDNHPVCINIAEPGSQAGPKHGKRNHPRQPGKRVPTPFLHYAARRAIPAAWRGQRVFLTLDNTCYHVTLRLDGKKVTHYVGGLEPHRLDVTRFVTPGRDLTIHITVGDSGTSGHRPFDTWDYTGTRLPACEEIVDNLVHPVNYGGSNRQVGSVLLEAVPAVRTEYVFADPKVSNMTLDYTVVVANDSDEVQCVRVRSAAGSGKVLIDEEVSVPRRSRTKVRRVIRWSDAVLWEPDRPHLYALRTLLRQGRRILDTHEDAFGFRDFTIDGHSFFLNGVKIHLFNQSGHNSPLDDWMTLDEKIAFLRRWKEEGHINHIRLHAKPQHKEWVLAADRVGLLVTTETALWTTGHYSFDWAGSEEACYRNVRNHFLQALVRRDRNNPSVVLWSLTNEMSPITRFDLENPKMAAMARVLKRIIDETVKEDDSRIIQMSSAMDFVGNLPLYNLHYPKSWQAYPDYPHTAYWLEEGFLFPWYGPGSKHLPAWSWRRDKPLVFGEFGCVYGKTPDSQASIVGDIAFEEGDYGSSRVNAKLWPMEIAAYRRQDVSGFCAWACLFPGSRDIDAHFRRRDVVAHNHALRPVAVLCHTYRTPDYRAGLDIALELSMHNDTRTDKRLALVCSVSDGKQTVWEDTWPAARFAPAEGKAFTFRCRAPAVDEARSFVFRARLTADGAVADEWTRDIRVHPEKAGLRLPTSLAIYDPGHVLRRVCRERGLSGCRFIDDFESLAGRSRIRTLWLHFGAGKVTLAQWGGAREALFAFVRAGGRLVLDKPAPEALADLPVEIRSAVGFAFSLGNTVQITYGYNHAPQHPLMAGLTDEDLCLWGEDAYIAHRLYALPEEGNAVPLIMAGTAESGLTSSPFMELPLGRGAILLSSLELFEKLDETPVALELIGRIARTPPAGCEAPLGCAAGADSLRVLREVGCAVAEPAVSVKAAVAEPVALVDGDVLRDGDVPAVRAALRAGRTVWLHALDNEQTKSVLKALKLPGRVSSGRLKPGEWDRFRHTHPLCSGMSNNYLYWIVDKAAVAMWTQARLLPEPATSCIRLPKSRDGSGAWSLTARGAVTVYGVGKGRLVIDNLRWHLPDFDEPERARRYVGRMLTNLGVPLARGTGKRVSEDFETPEERRERGHF